MNNESLVTSQGLYDASQFTVYDLRSFFLVPRASGFTLYVLTVFFPRSSNLAPRASLLFRFQAFQLASLIA